MSLQCKYWFKLYITWDTRTKCDRTSKCESELCIATIFNFVSQSYWNHPKDTNTAWKVSIFGVILVCNFPQSDWIRRDAEYLSVFSPIAGTCRPDNSEYRHFSCSANIWRRKSKQWKWKKNSWFWYLFLFNFWPLLSKFYFCKGYWSLGSVSTHFLKCFKYFLLFFCIFCTRYQVPC